MCLFKGYCLLVDIDGTMTVLDSFIYDGFVVCRIGAGKDERLLEMFVRRFGNTADVDIREHPLGDFHVGIYGLFNFTGGNLALLRKIVVLAAVTLDNLDGIVQAG